MSLDRRHFAITAATAPLALAAGSAMAQNAPLSGPLGPSRAAPPTNSAKELQEVVARLKVEPFAQIVTFTRNKQTPKLRPFPLTQVRLGDGPFHDMHQW